MLPCVYEPRFYISLTYLLRRLKELRGARTMPGGYALLGTYTGYTSCEHLQFTYPIITYVLQCTYLTYIVFTL